MADPHCNENCLMVVNGILLSVSREMVVKACRLRGILDHLFVLRNNGSSYCKIAIVEIFVKDIIEWRKVRSMVNLFA